MWFGWTAALGVGSVLALLSAVVIYLTAPKATGEEESALSRS
jgi:predicted MFS family arabinose efflux permease